MKSLKFTKKLLLLAVFTAFSMYLAACNDNSIESDNESDDQFIERVVTNGYSGENTDDDDLMFSEVNDLDDGGAVGNSGGDTPIDSLMKWGRRITGVSKTINIVNEGDSIKNVTITTNITGVFMIVGTVNNVVDTITKPYTEEFKRLAIFKRVDRSPRPRHNWRLYKVSMLDGESKTPQVGSAYVQMNQLQVYKNGTLLYTFTGPDFTQNMFETKRPPNWSGSGIPEVNVGDEIKLVVNTYSAQSEQDIVAWHWGKRNHGFHREPFAMVSQTPNGAGWDRVYEKTFNIPENVRRKVLNGCISSSTYKSLHDDSPVEFATDLVGTPYRVRP